MAGPFNNLTRAQLEEEYSARRREVNEIAAGSPKALKLLAEVEQSLVANHGLRANGYGFDHDAPPLPPMPTSKTPAPTNSPSAPTSGPRRISPASRSSMSATAVNCGATSPATATAPG
jgi:hypothetical protein